MEKWSNSKRLLTTSEKRQLRLDKTHLFFWETDLFLIAKSALNIAYTLTESVFKKVHLECLKSLHKALELELKSIKIDNDYYAYENYVLKLNNFINIFSSAQNQTSYQKKVEFFQVLLDTFRQLPVVDFGDDTLLSFLN